MERKEGRKVVIGQRGDKRNMEIQEGRTEIRRGERRMESNEEERGKGKRGEKERVKVKGRK